MDDKFGDDRWIVSFFVANRVDSYQYQNNIGVIRVLGHFLM